MRHTEEQPYDIDELWPDEAELGAMLRSHYRRHPSPEVMAAHLLELRQVAEAERPRSVGGQLSRTALIGSVAACLLIAGLVLVGPLRSRTETTGEDNTDTPTTGLEAPANEVDSGPGPQSINDNRSTSPVTGRIESDSGPRADSDGNTDTDTNGGSDSRTGTETGSDAIAVFDRATKPATTIGATPPSIASSPVPTPVSTTEPTPTTPKPSDLEVQQTSSAPASQSSTTESSITAPSTTLGTATTPTTTTSAVDTTAPPTTSAPTTTPPTTAPPTTSPPTTSPPTTSPPTTSPPTTSQPLLCLLPVIRILCI